MDAFKSIYMDAPFNIWNFRVSVRHIRLKFVVYSWLSDFIIINAFLKRRIIFFNEAFFHKLYRPQLKEL